MANGKIQIKDGAGNNLFPKVRTIDMTDSAGNVKLFDGEKIRPQFIPNAVDDIVPYAAVTSNAGVATVSQQADYHYINVTSKKIYATVHNGTSFVWDGGSALNTTTLYTSNGKSFRWDGTNLVEIVLPKAMASAINVNTNTNEFVPTVAATTAYFQPKGNYAAAGHNHNGTYVSKLVAGANITLSPATGTGGEITISATDTNTNLVSSVKGANGLTQNQSTGNVIISGVDTKGDSSTKGVVITTSVITSNAGGNTSVVPTMNAIYTALAGKAATHNHPYAATSHQHAISDVVSLQTVLDGKAPSNHSHDYGVTKLIAGTNITLNPATGVGQVTISATDTNTWAVSSVKGANGLTQNASTGNVIISGIDCTGNGITKGVVITTSVITSNAGGNTSVVPTMNAIYTALAGKAATNHTHNYAASDHITVVSKGNNNVTVGSAVNGSTTTYYVSTTDTNTWAVSTVSATNGVGMSNAVKTGTPVVSGIDCTGDGTTVGVIITSNGITSTTSNATNGPQSLKETKNIVPTMRAVYNALAGKADTGHTHNYAAANHNHDGVYQPKGTYATSNTSYTAAELSTNHSHNYTSVVLASGNGTTAGIVVTKSAIESNATSANTYEVPTMLAVYNALAGKAATGHNHDTVYAAKNHTHDFGVTKLVAGANITLNPATGVGQVTITATDTNTWAVSSVTGYNGLSANPTTGVVKVSGVDTKGDGTTRGIVITSNAIVSTVSTNAATGSQAALETSLVVPTMRAVYNALAGKAATTHTHNYITKNAGIAVNAYYFSGLADCPAMRSRYENASWFDSNTNSTGSYPGWLAPITADGMTEVLNTFSLGRGYTISGAGGSGSYSIANFGLFLSGCAVPTFMTFATAVSELSSTVAGKADTGHTHANYTSYTAAQLSTNHTHNYAAANHNHNGTYVSKIIAGNNITLNPTTGTGGEITISAKDTSYSLANGSTGHGVVRTSNQVYAVAGVEGNTYLVPTMNAVYNALAGKQNTIPANTYAPYTHTHGKADTTNSGFMLAKTNSDDFRSTTFFSAHEVPTVDFLRNLEYSANSDLENLNTIYCCGTEKTISEVLASKNTFKGTYVPNYLSAHAKDVPFGRIVYWGPKIPASMTQTELNQLLECKASDVRIGFYRHINNPTMPWLEVTNEHIPFLKGDSLCQTSKYVSGTRSACAYGPLIAAGTYVTSNTSYTAAELSTNHTHNYAAANHNHNTVYAATSHQHGKSDITDLPVVVVSKGNNTVTVGSSVNGTTTTYYVSATNTSYTAANLSTNHSHAIANVVGLQTALDSKAATGHTHSGYIRNQAAYAVDGYFFSGLSECSAMRSKYESTLWTHSGGSGTYPGWLAPITATGVTEITNLFNYCKGYASNASVNINVQSFFSACAVPTFMGFAHAIVELNNSLAGKQNTIAANTYAPYTHTHTGYATSNTSYTAAQLSTNHSHAVATSVAIQTGANNTQYATPQALAKGGFVRQFTDSINKTAAQMSADWANHESHHILFYNVTDAPAKNGFYMGKTGSSCTIEDQSAAWFCREKKNFYWLYKSNGNQYLSAFLPNADIVPTIIENHYSEITNNYITSMTTNFNNFTTINNNTFINIKFVKQYMMINNGIMIVT